MELNEKPWELTGRDLDQLPFPKALVWRRLYEYECQQVAQAAQRKLYRWWNSGCEHGKSRGYCSECLKVLRQGMESDG